MDQEICLLFRQTDNSWFAPSSLFLPPPPLSLSPFLSSPPLSLSLTPPPFLSQEPEVKYKTRTYGLFQLSLVGLDAVVELLNEGLELHHGAVLLLRHGL